MARNENWIKWDLCSREDHRMRFFLAGWPDKARAYGFFLWIIEKLYATNDGWIDHDEIFSNGFADEIGWSSDEVVQAIAKLIQAKLFLLEANRFASKRVLRALQERAELSKKRSKAGAKGGIKSATSKQVQASAKQKQAKSIDEIRSEKRDLSPLRGERAPDLKVFAPKISMSDEDYNQLISEFGADSIRYYLPVCSDWLVSNGKVKKSPPAFIRNWIRKDVAELKGFYFPKRNQNGRLSNFDKNMIEHEKLVELERQGKL